MPWWVWLLAVLWATPIAFVGAMIWAALRADRRETEGVPCVVLQFPDLGQGANPRARR